ncbi:MAG: redoxin domain-containing protein [Chryseolinea sp.]
MKSLLRHCLLSSMLMLFATTLALGQAAEGASKVLQESAGKHPSLAVGSKAIDFNLTGIDGKKYSLASFKSSKILVIAWTSNHCPTAQAYEDRLMKFTSDYSKKGVAVVAIMPNDPKSVSLSELGYTDYGDSYQEMQWRAKDKGFNFPYLYDGDTEVTSKAYGPIATPHIMIFDKDRVLRYSGRFDDVENPKKTPTTHDAINATEDLLAGRPVAVPTTKVFGCSTKWAEKADWRARDEAKWATEVVTLNDLDDAVLTDLKANPGTKLRLINIWSSTSKASVDQFTQFTDMHRMYRRRPWELINISLDDLAKRDEVSAILKQKYAGSTQNYIISDKAKLMAAIDPNWNGTTPYTLLVEPGGKVLYAKPGPINQIEIKKLIADSPTVGRYF